MEAELNSVLGDEEGLGDLAVPESLGGQLAQTLLAGREGVDSSEP